MKTPTAAEIMIPLEEYPHIPYWFTIRQALVELENAALTTSGGRRSLPRVVLVFNESYQLLGMARRRDLLRALQLDTVSGRGAGHRRLFRRDAAAPQEVNEEILGRLREHAERPVSDAMTPISATVSADDPLLKVARELVEHDVALLPVLREGSVAGVVRTVEVLHHVTALLGEA